MNPFVWNTADTPQEIAAALRELAAEYPFREMPKDGGCSSAGGKNCR